MKKILLATTALVLVAGAASAQQVTTKAPFTVTLGGSVRSDFIIASDDQANAQSREARLDYRLHIKAEAKAENGLTYGFDARLRNNQQGANQARQDVLGADRKYVYLGGSWGQIQLGDTPAPETNFEVHAPSVGIGQADYAFGIETGQFSYYQAYEDTYDTKMVYYTPVFSGFQAGISWAPEQGSHGRDNARSKFASTGGNLYRDLISVGAAYNKEFGDVSLAIGAGGQWGSTKRNAGVGDFAVWNVGVNVGYKGFTFGGNYYDNGETFLAKGDDQTGWQLGLTYATGAWAVGVNYARTETDYAARGVRDTTDIAYGIGAAYQLAPGLSLQADVIKFDAESADRSVLKARKTSNEGTLFTFRTRVDF